VLERLISAVLLVFLRGVAGKFVFFAWFSGGGIVVIGVVNVDVRRHCFRAEKHATVLGNL
jgi:hypothetical protein